MKTSSNYNAFNQLANSHKVQLSIDVHKLLVDEITNEAPKPSCEESIAQWAQLPVAQSTFATAMVAAGESPLVLEDQEMTVKLPTSFYQQAKLEIAAQETPNGMVKPLSAELMSQWSQPVQSNLGRQTGSQESFKPGATQLRRLITKYKGIVYTQSLPVVEECTEETLSRRLRPIMIDRRQEQQARFRWFGKGGRGYVPDNAVSLLDNARLRWSA